MKEMIYQKDRKVEVLHSGEYKGYKFSILNLGLHPTAYVENKAGFKGFGEADDYASPHGGFTYCGKAYWDKEDLTPYIGWDYGHCDDYAGYYDENCDIYLQGLKKWTTQEIFDEVKEVIDTLIKNTQEDHKPTDIEKLAEIIESARLKARDTLGSMNDGFGVWYATALVNAGYGDTKQAMREFAEKLKDNIIEDTAYGCDCRQHTGYYDYTIKIGDISDYIDKLVKEVCGE